MEKRNLVTGQSPKIVVFQPVTDTLGMVLNCPFFLDCGGDIRTANIP